MFHLTTLIKYIVSFFVMITQFVTRWAWREEYNFFNTFLKVKELNRDPSGEVSAELVMSKEDALVICHALVSVFNADVNFTEVLFKVRPEFTKGWKEDETIVVHIFRENGLSPSVLLDAARHERDQLRTQLIDELNKTK